MIKAGAIAKGTCLLFKNEPHLVVEREFVNPGKGSAFVRVRLKNIKSGLTVSQTFKTPESVEDVEVVNRNGQYLYADNESYHFMDTENFEQCSVAREGFEDKVFFLKEGDTYQLVFWENRALDIVLPYKMAFTVIESSEALKGDTVTGATKLVTLETGLKVRVPLFIRKDDKVLINTETKEYVERVK
jgi:elongation factor P